MSSEEARKWDQVKNRLNEDRLVLGPYFSYITRRTPRRLLHLLSYYKFAAKMIGNGQRVMDVGCSEGLGTLILAENANECLGVDLDEDAIDHAQASLGRDGLQFRCADVMEQRLGTFDAITNFDVIEHIFPEHAANFVSILTQCLSDDGILVVGTPNINADQYASEITRAGHVNLYSADRLREELAAHFKRVFLFCGNDEMVHTGFAPLAHYIIAIGAIPRHR